MFGRPLTERRRAAADIRRPAAPRVISIVVGAGFCLIGSAVLIKVAILSASSAAQWTGAIGNPPDSMQYLAWIREGASHILLSDRFVIEQTPRDFLSPALLLSSAFHVAGVPVGTAFALWVPVALIAIMSATWRLVSAVIDSRWGRVAAWAAALLYAVPVVGVVERVSPLAERLSVSERFALQLLPMDAWLPGLAWGYPLGLLAIALLCVGIEMGSRQIASGSSRALMLGAVAFGCALLQPWQGATLVATLGLTWIAWQRRSGATLRLNPRFRGLAFVLIGASLPLLYYAALGLIDNAWDWNGSQANTYFANAPWTIALFFAPLAILSIPGWKLAIQSPVDIAIRIWPAVSSVQMILILVTGIGNSASHAIRGVTIPLAIIAVQGFLAKHSLRRIIATALMASAIVLAAARFISSALDNELSSVSLNPASGYFLSADQSKTIRWLRNSPDRGGVIAPLTLSAVIVAHTDRNAWAGHFTWTKDFIARGAGLRFFYSPNETNPAKRIYLAAVSKARFVVAPCDLPHTVSPKVLVKQLQPIAKSTVWNGCYAVVTLKGTPLE